MRFLLVICVAGCASAPAALSADHPANPKAPTGRIAPAPASLRANVIAYPDVPKTQAPAPAHHHHHP